MKFYVCKPWGRGGDRAKPCREEYNLDDGISQKSGVSLKQGDRAWRRGVCQGVVWGGMGGCV